MEIDDVGDRDVSEWKTGVWKKEKDFSEEANAVNNRILLSFKSFSKVLEKLPDESSIEEPGKLLDSRIAPEISCLIPSATWLCQHQSDMEHLSNLSSEEMLLRNDLIAFLNMEKRARLAGDIDTVTFISQQLLRIYKLASRYLDMVDLMEFFLQRRGQAAKTQATIVGECYDGLQQLSDNLIPVSNELIAETVPEIETLLLPLLRRFSKATRSKLHVELEHTYSTLRLVKVLVELSSNEQSDSQVMSLKNEAFELLQDLQIENVSSMARGERTLNLLYHIAFCIYMQDYPRSGLLLRKIGPQALEEASKKQFDIPRFCKNGNNKEFLFHDEIRPCKSSTEFYLRCRILYHMHNSQYSEVARCWWEWSYHLRELKELLLASSDEEQSSDTVSKVTFAIRITYQKAVLFLLICSNADFKRGNTGEVFPSTLTAPVPDPLERTKWISELASQSVLSGYHAKDLSQIDHSVDKQSLFSMTLLKDLAMDFLGKSPISSVKADEKYFSPLSKHPFFNSYPELLAKICTQLMSHNVILLSKCYTRCTLQKLCELLELPIANIEIILMNLVSEGAMHAKIDRARGIVVFESVRNADASVTEQWSLKLEKLYQCINETCHLIAKERMQSGLHRTVARSLYRSYYPSKIVA